MSVFFKLIAGAFLLVIFGQITTPAYANNQNCINANPESATDVYECIATATAVGRANMILFTRTEKLACNKLQGIYSQALAQSGGMTRDQLKAKIPSCDVFSDALMELNGTRPDWHDCLGYDGTTSHVVQCVKGVMERAMAARGVPELRRQAGLTTMLSNCIQVTGMYEMMIMSVAGYGAHSMPEGYKRVDCDDYLNNIQSAVTGISKDPCSGFDPNNIAAHARQCIMGNANLANSPMKLSCASLRQTYMGSLTAVYGSLPQGYRSLPCSVLNPISEELFQKNK